MDKVIVLPLGGKSVESGPFSVEDRADDALMLMVRAGVDRAFEVLVRRHQRMVLGTAVKYLFDPNIAEDIAQNSFVDLLRCVPFYRPDGKFRAFLAKIVINNCRMANRRARSEKSKRQRLFGVAGEAEVQGCESGAVEQRERQRLLNAAMQRISPKLREVLILRYGADFSLKEIGDTLGIRIGTVKSRLFSGVEKLAEVLEAMES